MAPLTDLNVPGDHLFGLSYGKGGVGRKILLQVIVNFDPSYTKKDPLV